MGQQLKWNEIKKRYPNEWVAVVNYTTTPTGDVNGEVAAHSGNKTEFYRCISDVISQNEGTAVRYTGELITNEAMPLLWRTLHTA